ncbi:hypothetical protein [Candidatus Erwinia dacicola]|uniref:Sucrose operon repressor domain protein n=1 Tax=Candidatus Erwinia dacicola TaxID=252393 RepID=A0A328TM95_9GAMM|nr:sucrose operon repressor domain protein [Candidatus Erwinia dacicola]
MLIDTVEQDERLLAWNCFEMITRLIDEQLLEETQRCVTRTVNLAPCYSRVTFRNGYKI